MLYNELKRANTKSKLKEINKSRSLSKGNVPLVWCKPLISRVIGKCANVRAFLFSCARRTKAKTFWEINKTAKKKQNKNQQLLSTDRSTYPL